MAIPSPYITGYVNVGGVDNPISMFNDHETWFPLSLIPLKIGTIVKEVVDECLSSSSTLSSDQHKVTLKWPNDVLIDGKKVAGVLIQSESPPPVGGGGSAPVFLIGVGINVFSAPAIPSGHNVKNGGRESCCLGGFGFGEATTSESQGGVERGVTFVGEIENEEVNDESQRWQGELVLKVGQLVVKKVGQWIAELEAGAGASSSNRWREKTVNEATSSIDLLNPVRIRGEFATATPSASTEKGEGEWVLPMKILKDGSLEVRVVQGPDEEGGSNNYGRVKTLVSEYLF
jgi:hypothetical protein